MKKNIGSADRIIRIVASAIFIALSLTGIASGIAAIILPVIGLVLMITSFFGVCPLYFPFHISTLDKEEQQLEQ